MTIRGVILDVDGTLVDSNDAHARSWVDAFARFGLQVPYERVRRLIGKGGDRLLREAADVDAKSNQGETIEETRTAIFVRDYLPEVKTFPGTRELLERMRREGLRLVVASSSGEEILGPLLERTGAPASIEGRPDSDEVQSSKPSPDIVNAALERLGLPASDVVMIGDTPYDVAAAEDAGVAIVAVRSGGWDDDALSGALAIYDDAADLLERFDTSPLSRRE